MLRRQRYTISPDGKSVRTPGISWGYGQGSRLNLIQSGEFYQVWHKPTTRDWAGRAMGAGTSPAIYYLVRVDGNRVQRVIEEVEPGHKWRATRECLIKKCIRMNRLVTKLLWNGVYNASN